MPRWSVIDKLCEYFQVSREYFFQPDVKEEQKEKPAETEVDLDKLMEDILNLPRDKKEKLAVLFMEMLKNTK